MISSRLFSVMIVEREGPQGLFLKQMFPRVPDHKVVASCSNAMEASRMICSN
jgi:hypothetical protein